MEELQKELTLEREQRATKEASFAQEINQLQETEVAKENKGVTHYMYCGLFMGGPFLKRSLKYDIQLWGGRVQSKDNL